MDGYNKTCKFLDAHDSYISQTTAVTTLYVRLYKSGSFHTCNIQHKITVELKDFEHVSLVSKLYVIQFLLW